MAKGQRLCAKPQLCRAGRRKKKRKFGNAKHAILTTNCRFVDLTMRVHKRILVEKLFSILALQILVGASTFAFSLTVICIMSSFCLACNTFDFLRPRPLTNASVVFQMPSSSAIVQKMLGYKCIAPGCEKMFDNRKGYNMHRSRRIYEGTACADIRNGRQLFSRGAGSGDKPKLFSIPIAPQHGANHDAAQMICVKNYAVV